MKKYVYMVEFDWSVEDGCDIETELFATYDKALERYNQLVNEEKTMKTVGFTTYLSLTELSLKATLLKNTETKKNKKTFIGVA